MLMGHDHGRDHRGTKTEACKTPLDFPDREPAVDQDPCVAALDHETVPPAAAAEQCKPQRVRAVHPLL